MPDMGVAQWVVLHALPLARRHSVERPLPPPQPQPRSVWISRSASNAPLRVVLLDPQPSMSGKPAFLQIHGGGFILGSPENNLPRLQRLAQQLGALIVAPAYRLAPESPFPAALDDNLATLQWLRNHAAELGVNTSRIAIMGESAGGGLAAMVTIANRDHSEAPLCFQALFYPMLDDRTGATQPIDNTPGHAKFVWNAAANRRGWSDFLVVPAGSANVPAGAVPARVELLSGIPPTFIGVGELDLFFDEDLHYAEHLRSAGVPVTFMAVPGAYHGFDQLNPDAAATHNFNARWIAAWRRACAS